MTLVDAAATATHQVFAALWVGSIVFMTVGVLPMAKEGSLEPDSVERASQLLRTISRVSALLLVLTGGYLALSYYGADGLTANGRGHMVLTMAALWLVLAGLIEVSASRLEDGLQAKKVRGPAHETLGWYRAASVIGVVVLIIGGFLSAGWPV